MIRTPKKTQIKDLSKFGDNNHADAVERLEIREDGVSTFPFFQIRYLFFSKECMITHPLDA